MIILEVLFGLLDVLLLSALISSAEQQNDPRADPTEVDPISGTAMDPELKDPVSHRLAVSKIPHFETVQPGKDSAPGVDLAYRANPVLEGRFASATLVDLDLEAHFGLFFECILKDTYSSKRGQAFRCNCHGTLTGHYGVIDCHWWPQLAVDEIAFPRYPECCHLLKGFKS